MPVLLELLLDIADGSFAFEEVAFLQITNVANGTTWLVKSFLRVIFLGELLWWAYRPRQSRRQLGDLVSCSDDRDLSAVWKDQIRLGHSLARMLVGYGNVGPCRRTLLFVTLSIDEAFHIVDTTTG